MALVPRRLMKQLEMRARLGAPEWVRRIYRVSRGGAAVPASKALPDELVRDCRFFASRIAMLDALPRQAVVVELGTLRGDFARQILVHADPSVLHVVDIDFSAFDRAIGRDGQVHCHNGLTHEVMAEFADRSVDWVYVDADHSYEGVLRDARAAAAKVRPGGYLVFNDFAHVDPAMGRYGVHRAVVDFAVEAGWPFRMFAYEGSALYDVALQKPQG